jgi:hypothetical protein
MSAALTPPLLVAAGVLCLAGALKLRNPAPAVGALSILGLRATPIFVRAFATVEIALGGWAMLGAGRAAAAAIAGMYASFAVLALLLARRQASCGCFGEDRTPASALQSMLSAALALIALGAALFGAHGLGWVIGRGPASAGTLLIGIAGAVYATAIAYTELPAAWSAWSVR